MENLLPAEIKLDIFSRLPVESVLQCRQVCKTWRTLLHQSCFPDMHLHRSLQLDKVGLFYCHGKFNGCRKQLYYGEHDENEEETHETLKRINHPPVNIHDHVVGSCNGLICFSVRNIYGIDDSIYICNPITREYVNLPRYIDDVGPRIFHTYPVVYEFGYLCSTDEYKVVRIFTSNDPYQSQPFHWVSSVQVYTLGGGSEWRKKGEIKFSPSEYCVHANGALYWLDHEEKNIVAFDLADEQFHFLPLPPLVEPSDISYLRAFGGLLTVVHRNFEKSLDIWSLRKKNSSTNDVKVHEHQSWSWDREHIIPFTCLEMPRYDPFALTKSGEILMWSDPFHHFRDYNNHSLLFSYNPKTEYLNGFITDFQFLEAIPHVNSFISLKSLGEDVKILGSAEGFQVPAMWQHIWERFKWPRIRGKISRRKDENVVQDGNKKRKRCKACGDMAGPQSQNLQAGRDTQ